MPAHVPRQPLSGALRQYGRLLSDPVYLGHALTGGIAIAGMFAYIAGSPFVFIKLYGVPAEHFGWLFGTNAAGFILVAQVNARLLAKRGPAFLLARAVWVYLAAGLTLLAVSALHTEQLWPLLIPLFICIASLGCILPNASACAMNGQGARAGSASAMLGCLQFSVAAGAASLVGILYDGTRRADGHGHQPVRDSGGERGDAHPAFAKCPGAGASPGLRTDSASGALLVVGNLMRGVQTCFKCAGERAGFGFATERHRVLVQADLPLGFCHFFYQDLHC